MNDDPLLQLLEDGLTFDQWLAVQGREEAEIRAKNAKLLDADLEQANGVPEKDRWHYIASARSLHARRESRQAVLHESAVNMRKSLHLAETASVHWHENHNPPGVEEVVPTVFPKPVRRAFLERRAGM